MSLVSGSKRGAILHHSTYIVAESIEAALVTRYLPALTRYVAVKYSLHAMVFRTYDANLSVFELAIKTRVYSRKGSHARRSFQP